MRSKIVATWLSAAAIIACGVLVWGSKPWEPKDVIKPYAIVAIKDCGHLMGVLVVDQTGEIHNMPGPFSPQTKAGIADLAHKVPDQKKNLATIDMPCHADGDKTPQGGGTDT